MLGSIQLIVHLPLLAINFPSNVIFVFGLVIDLVNFKLLDVSVLTGNVTGVKKETKEGVKGQYGYSGSMFQSLGLIFIVIIGGIGLIIVGKIIYHFSTKLPRVRRFLYYISTLIFFNSIIRTFIQTYLSFALSSFYNFKELKFESGSLII